MGAQDPVRLLKENAYLNVTGKNSLVPAFSMVTVVTAPIEREAVDRRPDGKAVVAGMLYNDIRFCLTGVIINYPIRYDSLVLRMTPTIGK